MPPPSPFILRSIRGLFSLACPVLDGGYQQRATSRLGVKNVAVRTRSPIEPKVLIPPDHNSAFLNNSTFINILEKGATSTGSSRQGDVARTLCNYRVAETSQFRTCCQSQEAHLIVRSALAVAKSNERMAKYAFRTPRAAPRAPYGQARRLRISPRGPRERRRGRRRHIR